jgi:hypothetical protein
MFRHVGYVLGGFVAGEGCFSVSRRGQNFVRDGSPRLRFRFGVAVASRDRPLLETLAMFLGTGTIREHPPAEVHHQPTSVFEIASARRHHAVTIPFAETFLLPCRKREQFERWRSRLVEYEANRPSQYGRGPSRCSMPDCGKPVRGRGLCRSHYYRVTGY